MLTVALLVCAGAGGLGAAAAAGAARSASATPAQLDAGAALASAKAAVKSAGLAGLVSAGGLQFSFPTTAGDCPLGTNDPSYCTGGTGKLTFQLSLARHHRSARRLANVTVRITAGGAVTVDATIGKLGMDDLSSDASRHVSATLTLVATAVLITTYASDKATLHVR